MVSESKVERITMSSSLVDFRNPPPYVLNYQSLDDYLVQFRDHQEEAFERAQANHIGQIISPCGTGKTLEQVAIHISTMVAKHKAGLFGKFLIASHRLALNSQLSKPLITLAIECGLPFDVLFVGSGRYDFDQWYADFYYKGFIPQRTEFLATLSTADIEFFATNARRRQRHLIILSTYHSLDRLANIGQIDVATFDEAHNTVAKDFTQKIWVIAPHTIKRFFFTATRKIDGDEGGMNDEELYGKVIADAFPLKMIAAGEIVCPKLHTVDAEIEYEETGLLDLRMLVKNTIEAFERHAACVANESFDSTKLSAKMLVACNGISEMMRIYEDPTFWQYCQTNGIHCFAISSEDGSFYNQEKMTRQKFMETLESLSDTEEAIIFNVDILTEGINLPAITGVMPMRNMSNTKLIQLFGRSLRLHPEDRRRLYAELLRPEDYKNYIKPYGWLIMPRHLATLSFKEEMMAVVKAVCNEFGSTPEQMVVQERYINIDRIDLDSIIPIAMNNVKEIDLEHEEFDIIEELRLAEFKAAEELRLEEINCADNKNLRRLGGLK